MISWSDFEKLNIRVGKVVEASEFNEARAPAYKLLIDFGPFGIKKSSAQLTKNYSVDELKDRLVVAVMNFPPKQIGPMTSEVLVLGLPDKQGEPVLVTPDKALPLGGRLY